MFGGQRDGLTTGKASLPAVPRRGLRKSSAVESVDPVKGSALTVCTAPSSLHWDPEEQKGRGRRSISRFLDWNFHVLLMRRSKLDR